MIVTDLEALAVDIDTLSTLPGNPRRGDVPAVVRSLEQFGQRKPIVARRDGTVIAGNHTLTAARELGWKTIAVVWVDDDESTAKAFALADNRTSELGGYDGDALVEMLRDVAEAGDTTLYLATGYSESDLARMLANDQPAPPDTAAMLDAQTYAVIVSCEDEMHQADLLDRFKRDGLAARPLMM